MRRRIDRLTQRLTTTKRLCSCFPISSSPSLEAQQLWGHRRSIHISSSTSLENSDDSTLSVVPKPLSTTTTTALSAPYQFQVHNSLTGRIDPLPLAVPHSSSSDSSSNRHQSFQIPAMYTCGPTVYAPAHLGHARTYVWLDIVRRVWEASNGLSGYPKPVFCLNITNVDDKILAAAVASNEAPLDLAGRYERDFWKDWDALHCLRPTIVTRVTDQVETAIIPYIRQLMETGMAYEIGMEQAEKENSNHDNDDESSNGTEEQQQEQGVYFDVRAYEEQAQRFNSRYGKLAPPMQSSDVLDHTEQDSTSTHKRDARDFALWKRRKDGERMYWSSPWGDGRPGWHIECSAMIEHIQQQQLPNQIRFVVHAGGVDLKFPHHTNEIAQAEAYHLKASHEKASEWIPHWIHTGHLHIDGLKMSKSLKNFIPIADLWEKSITHEHSSFAVFDSPADDFRWWCLSTSYRGTATYSEERLQHAQRMREKVVRFLMDAQDWLQQQRASDHDNGTLRQRQQDNQLVTCALEESARGMRALLQSDLDGTTFLAAVMAIVDQGDRALKKKNDDDTRGDVGSSYESVQTAVDSLRGMLSLVGFTDATSRAGLLRDNNDNRDAGTGAILDELVSFRATVRELAIESLRKQESGMSLHKKTLQDILKHCDELRDNTLPSIGVELMDSKLSMTDTNDKTNAAWRFCAPRSPNHQAGQMGQLDSSSSSNETHLDVKNIPLQDYFRVGQYEGQFREYDETGFPLSNADGTELSNRQQKKLLKKRDRHAKRLQPEND